MKRALFSVSDKEGIVRLASILQQYGVEIIASGGTAEHLKAEGIESTPLETITGNPEAFGGRMKSISFSVASALLYRRDHEGDLAEAFELGVLPIDLVVCNLYPFLDYAKRLAAEYELIEKIDIGGPTMIRAAAKNYRYLTVLNSSQEYEEFLENIQTHDGRTDLAFRKKCSLRSFKMIADYDSAIAIALQRRWENEEASPVIHFSSQRAKKLRYGENPHQRAFCYANSLDEIGLAAARPLQGKELSYNNLLDADAAIRCNHDLLQLESSVDFPAVATIVKHQNTCGAAMGQNAKMALELAWSGDPISSFGSIICLNSAIEEASALWLSDKFIEVIIAPSFSTKAQAIFSSKKNLRLLQLDPLQLKKEIVSRSIWGGQLVQEDDWEDCKHEFTNVTTQKFSNDKMVLADFGTVVAKHLKSNAIALVKKSKQEVALVGAGMGNPNRLLSIKQAAEKARENGHSNLSEVVLASDGFFPFADNVKLCAQWGIRSIVQPGGSIKDQEVIAACNELGLSMLFTKRRHFRH
ncbi:MAG: bifunctional phosphoribosylaminoimidazolecarboxamide formyltransferase/IMP cyclohydrolase [Bdellovibrionales bacterium RIFOXYD12_FULL_39_22]|nr:MAG: bifunctional phosphoribosylaminoimidazolecarboxamide formyltransferase/IMP cyclohydrolase [Bdellovibrionales bacterium RIFOXYB1_FULL_39_21]OFZ40807.1 MAG: bifunctional phosphoribosylaminoimidazolecarboxamide formyltransferase/IMP cyclohydrolase [Bdellovibrionales bacterium RIFOXYC12_FULL_39_17]OFZ48229.1 MAG: bifunctional phosphoribosylaminoimidazolecarboxamide formyltransferase/IMP cyclohydrolase [Bdellovibrionales bacterium RIFOXYC1_FULL_39_130]OFZ70638.1 MAG: bifunctional phosphoribos